MLTLKKLLGNSGEDFAADYLKNKKYKILERNFSSKCGEIDIIAYQNNYYVFVEVKTRSKNSFGAPSEAVDYYKRQRIIKTSMLYLGNKFNNSNIRYDVIEVYNNDGVFDLNHIENAFGG